VFNLLCTFTIGSGLNLASFLGITLVPKKLAKTAHNTIGGITMSGIGNKCTRCPKRETCPFTLNAGDLSEDLLNHLLDDLLNGPLLGQHIVRIGIPIGMPTRVSIPNFLQKEIPAEVMDYLANTDAVDIKMIVVEDGKATIHKKDGTTMTIPPASNNENPKDKPTLQ